MESDVVADALDEIVGEVDALYPDVDVIGLPVVGRVLRLARLLEARRDEQLGAHGLTVADFDVLATMRRRAAVDPVNVRDLQSWVMLSSGGITKRLDRLESAGLIERRRDPNDRRGVLIVLTDDGFTLIDQVLPAVASAESELLARAIPSDGDRERVVGGLRQLLTTMED